jgi:hypothetical protein
MFLFREQDLKPLCRQFSMETPLCSIIYKINPIIQFSVEGEYTDLAVIYLCTGMYSTADFLSGVNYTETRQEKKSRLPREK